jgi:hypothetical protein
MGGPSGRGNRRGPRARQARRRPPPIITTGWRALENLLAHKGTVLPDELRARRNAWHRAAMATPHGQPIVLPGRG